MYKSCQLSTQRYKIGKIVQLQNVCTGVVAWHELTTPILLKKVKMLICATSPNCGFILEFLRHTWGFLMREGLGYVYNYL